jgi:hypothetical protein
VVGLVRRLVGANACDARKAQGDAGFVAGGRFGGVEGDFEDEAGGDFANGAEAVGGVSRIQRSRKASSASV